MREKLIYEARPVTPGWVYTPEQEKEMRRLNLGVFDALVTHLNDGRLISVEFIDFREVRSYDTRSIDAKVTGVVALDENNIGGQGSYRFVRGKKRESLYDLHDQKISTAKRFRHNQFIFISPPRCNTALDMEPARSRDDNRALYRDQWITAERVERGHIKRISVTDIAF